MRDYGEERAIELVHYRRKHKQIQTTGTEDMEPKFAGEYLKKLLHGQHDSERVYLERCRQPFKALKSEKNW